MHPVGTGHGPTAPVGGRPLQFVDIGGGHTTNAYAEARATQVRGPPIQGIKTSVGMVLWGINEKMGAGAE